MRPKNNFITGFLSALLLGLVWIWYSFAYFRGGHIENSPSGRYSLSIDGPLNSSSFGGTYEIELRDTRTERVLRTYTIQLDPNERLMPLRATNVTIQWDAAETTADITVDGEFLIRVAVAKPVTDLNNTTNASEY